MLVPYLYGNQIWSSRCLQGFFLLTCFNFNPCMDKQLNLLQRVDVITYPFPTVAPLKFGNE